MIRLVGALLLMMFLSLQAQASQPSIVTSIHPLALVVKELVGDQAQVSALVPTNVSPHHYSMRPSERRRLQNAHRFIWLGPTLEPFLADTLDDADLKRRSLALANVGSDQEYEGGDGHSHGAGEQDPHIWLNPDRIRAMLPAMVDFMATVEGLDRAQLEENLQRFRERLSETESGILERLAGLPPMDVFTYHGAFDHFAEHFGVRIAGTLTANPERNPGARHLAELQRKLRNAQAPCLMVEPQFSKDWWEGLEIGQPVGVSHWDPLASEIGIRQGGYTRLLEQLTDALVNCNP